MKTPLETRETVETGVGATSDRRRFLKQTALASAAAVLAARTGTASAATAPAPAAAPADTDTRWEKAPCRFCGTGCHVEVGVREGRIVGIRGDAKAEVNRGLLCVKGYHVGMILY
ncbi:MAG: hypothetical protein JNL97_07250, partial [Verrucomicrobiales bacterium]|nr:hypothetical protein [Verrucomicrobiales bacterium]